MALLQYMSPINRKTIEEKLFKFQETTKVLNDLKAYSKEEFIKDAIINSAAMFNLVIAVEVIVDIGNHILVEDFQRSVKTYTDIIIELGDIGVIPKEFAQENKDMAKFRNKLIHDYDRVSLDQVYEHLQKAPDIFRQFSKHFINFLENKK